MNKSDLERLTQERLKDAETLLNHGQWSGAYYLAGYVVECAIKACIARETKAYDFPDKVKADKVFTHNIKALLDVALLRQKRDQDMANNLQKEAYWNLVEAWNERARYNQWTETQARELYEAVTDPQQGVYQWIIRFW